MRPSRSSFQTHIAGLRFFYRIIELVLKIIYYLDIGIVFYLEIFFSVGYVSMNPGADLVYLFYKIISHGYYL